MIILLLTKFSVIILGKWSIFIQQLEEEMQRIEAENQAAMQAAEDLPRKQVAQRREGEKEEEIEIKDDPMAKAEADSTQ
ncbi:glycine-rich RNA-binding protein [Spatholobus suberectus]|nr:glycine-rich RNA-binding protein [Spatholobus suberectus]